MTEVIRDWIRVSSRRQRAGGSTLSAGQRKARLVVCKRVVENQGNVSDAATELGMAPNTLWRWLLNNDPDLLESLVVNGRFGRSTRLTRDERVRRLRLVATIKPRSVVAERLGITQAGLSQFMRRWAPDGAKAALEALGVRV